MRVGHDLYDHCTFDEDIVCNGSAFATSDGTLTNEMLETIEILYFNGWTGLDENGEPIKWDGINLNEMQSREIKQFLTDDFSLVHVYFKDLHILKYQKEKNYGAMELIGSFLYY